MAANASKWREFRQTRANAGGAITRATVARDPRGNPSLPCPFTLPCVDSRAGPALKYSRAGTKGRGELRFSPLRPLRFALQDPSLAGATTARQSAGVSREPSRIHGHNFSDRHTAEHSPETTATVEYELTREPTRSTAREVARPRSPRSVPPSARRLRKWLRVAHAPMCGNPRPYAVIEKGPPASSPASLLVVLT